jgi:hypothetical protein
MDKREIIKAEIRAYQTIIDEAQLEKSKLEKELNELNMPEIKLEDYKEFYFRGDKLIIENLKEIKISCDEEDKTKQTQQNLTQWFNAYHPEIEISGKKEDDKVAFCKNIKYNDNIIPFAERTVKIAK